MLRIYFFNGKKLWAENNINLYIFFSNFPLLLMLTFLLESLIVIKLFPSPNKKLFGMFYHLHILFSTTAECIINIGWWTLLLIFVCDSLPNLNYSAIKVQIKTMECLLSFIGNNFSVITVSFIFFLFCLFHLFVCECVGVFEV